MCSVSAGSGDYKTRKMWCTRDPSSFGQEWPGGCHMHPLYAVLKSLVQDGEKQSEDGYREVTEFGLRAIIAN